MTVFRICKVSTLRTLCRLILRWVWAQLAMMVWRLNETFLGFRGIMFLLVVELLDDAATGKEDALEVHLELLRRIGELEGDFLGNVAVFGELE